MNISNFTDADYKRFVEARVSNQTGTTLSEVVLVTLSCIAASAASSAVFHKVARATRDSSSSTSLIAARIAEWLLLVPPLIACVTSPSETDTGIRAAIVFLLLLLATVTFFSQRGGDSAGGGGSNKKKAISSSASSSSFLFDSGLALLKGSLMLQTVLAILAVDFMPFPGRFMKTETFGISLMDVGVGAFVFTSALSHAVAQAKRKETMQKNSISEGDSGVVDSTELKRGNKSTHADRDAGKKATSIGSSSSNNNNNNRSVSTAGMSSSFSAMKALYVKIQQQLRSCVPLLCLGFARLAAVKGSDYQEHVSEYGVHWNFFFTYGALPIVVSLAHALLEPLLILALSSSASSSSSSSSALLSMNTIDGIAGGALLLLHQLLLSSYGGTDYVMSKHRRTLVEANKEGIVSSLGYAALYLLSGSIYSVLLSKSVASSSSAFNKNSSSLSSRIQRCVNAFVVGAAITALAFFVERIVQTTSRRLCNAPYVFFCIGVGFVAYGLCTLCARGGDGQQEESYGNINNANKTKKNKNDSSNVVSVKDILSCIHENQLFLFLIANLCTGAVNKSMRTVFASDAVAFLILAVYVTLVLGVAGLLAARNIRIKL